MVRHIRGVFFKKAKFHKEAVAMAGNKGARKTLVFRG